MVRAVPPRGPLLTYLAASPAGASTQAGPLCPRSALPNPPACSRKVLTTSTQPLSLEEASGAGERERVRNADPRDGHRPRPVARVPRGSVLLTPETGGGSLHSLSPTAHQRASHLGNTAFSKPIDLPVLLQNTQLPFGVLRRSGERRPLKRPAAALGLGAQGA